MCKLRERTRCVTYHKVTSSHKRARSLVAIIYNRKPTKERTQNSTVSNNTKVTDQETIRRLHVCFKSRRVSSDETKTVVLSVVFGRLMAHSHPNDVLVETRNRDEELGLGVICDEMLKWDEIMMNKKSNTLNIP